MLQCVADMRKRLSELEQLVMDTIWARPGASSDAVRAGLAESGRPLKESTVRTLLARLEKKGYVSHEVEGRTYLYHAVGGRQNVAAEAVRQIIDRFCGGSLEQLLVGMVDNRVVSRKELGALARKIAAAKKERV